MFEKKKKVGTTHYLTHNPRRENSVVFAGRMMESSRVVLTPSRSPRITHIYVCLFSKYPSILTVGLSSPRAG